MCDTLIPLKGRRLVSSVLPPGFGEPSRSATVVSRSLGARPRRSDRQQISLLSTENDLNDLRHRHRVPLFEVSSLNSSGIIMPSETSRIQNLSLLRSTRGRGRRSVGDGHTDCVAPRSSALTALLGTRRRPCTALIPNLVFFKRWSCCCRYLLEHVSDERLKERSWTCDCVLSEPRAGLRLRLGKSVPDIGLPRVFSAPRVSDAPDSKSRCAVDKTDGSEDNNLIEQNDELRLSASEH